MHNVLPTICPVYPDSGKIQTRKQNTSKLGIYLCMFSEGGLVMILGICMALAFITLSVYFVYKLFARGTQEILVRFILMIFTALVALFIVDKTVAWKVNLITPEQNKELFDLIKTLILMIFSYYFGTKEKPKE